MHGKKDGGVGMRVVCVESDESALNQVLSVCRELPDVDYATGFTDIREARTWLEMDHADLLLLAVKLKEMSGIDLAAKLREKYARLAIIFLAEDAQHALEAYAVHPFGYLIKPFDPAALAAQINQLLLSRAETDVSHISVHTFGAFSVAVDGRAVHFERAKAKELLALLIDRRGGEVSRKVAFTEMWEDREYDAKAQNYFNVIVNSLRDTLHEYGISEIFEIGGGFMRIRPELVDCDLYRYLRGEPEAEMEFRGFYLYGYSWAVWNEGY